MSHQERLFGFEHAFDHPLTLWITVAIAGCLALAPIVFSMLGKGLPLERRTELWVRWKTWLVIAPAIILPILAGAFWTITALTLLGIRSQREFSRMTGAFRDGRGDIVAAIMIFVIGFAALDHWYEFFNAMTGIGVVVIAAVELVGDRPRGYIRRTALATLGLLLFGTCLLHLAYLANDPGFRPKLLLIVVAVGVQDVLAFTIGRIFGRRKLAPQISPGKTVEGALGAMLVTTAIFTAVSGLIWTEGALAHPLVRAAFGISVAIAAQCGDLILSAIKRDVGVKDCGRLLPGHGGLLDRFDSLILAAPVAFHIMAWCGGFRWVGPGGIFTG